MGYRTVVVASPAKITVKNSQLVIEGEHNGTVPIEDLRSLMLESRASTVTAYALSALSEAGVCVYICDEKHLPSAVLQPIGRYSRIRKQILTQLSQGKPHLKRMWQSIVVKKIKNQAKCLELCGVAPEYYGNVSRLAGAVGSGDPTNVEGQAAALYFKYLFGKSFARGQETPINAALNYGYAIMRGYIARTVANYGYEPSIGLHHRSELNPYNLADDLIEPFRPLVDLFVFQTMPEDVFEAKERHALCGLLNLDVISDGECHTAAYAVERLVQSLERCLAEGGESEMLLLPDLKPLALHEYE